MNSASLLFLVSCLSFFGKEVQSAGLVAQFSCWFPTYVNGTRINNAVMGYLSTLDGGTMIPPGGGNVLVTDGTPSTNVANIFFIGLGTYPFAYYVSNATFVQWSLNGSFAEVDFQIVTNATLCYNVFNKTCPTPEACIIPHFCEDGSFCNGAEDHQNFKCIPGTEPVCPGQSCIEQPPHCATFSPTTQPPPTNVPSLSPTVASTTIMPSIRPTVSPTAAPTNSPTTVTPTTILPTSSPTQEPTTITASPTTTTTITPTPEPPSGSPPLLITVLVFILVLLITCLLLVFFARRRQSRNISRLV